MSDSAPAVTATEFVPKIPGKEDLGPKDVELCLFGPNPDLPRFIYYGVRFGTAYEAELTPGVGDRMLKVSNKSFVFWEPKEEGETATSFFVFFSYQPFQIVKLTYAKADGSLHYLFFKGDISDLNFPGTWEVITEEEYNTLYLEAKRPASFEKDVVLDLAKCEKHPETTQEGVYLDRNFNGYIHLLNYTALYGNKITKLMDGEHEVWVAKPGELCFTIFSPLINGRADKIRLINLADGKFHHKFYVRVEGKLTEVNAAAYYYDFNNYPFLGDIELNLNAEKFEKLCVIKGETFGVCYDLYMLSRLRMMQRLLEGDEVIWVRQEGQDPSHVAHHRGKDASFVHIVFFDEKRVLHHSFHKKVTGGKWTTVPEAEFPDNCRFVLV